MSATRPFALFSLEPAPERSPAEVVPQIRPGTLALSAVSRGPVRRSTQLRRLSYDNGVSTSVQPEGCVPGVRPLCGALFGLATFAKPSEHIEHRRSHHFVAPTTAVYIGVPNFSVPLSKKDRSRRGIWASFGPALSTNRPRAVGRMTWRSEFRILMS